MNRYRWLSAKWPITTTLLSKALQMKRYDNSSVFGFVIDRVRDSCLEARYIEKIDFTETIVNPFGEEILVPRVEFIQCEFRVSTKVEEIGLELINQPKSTQGLISNLIEACSFKLAIAPVKVDVIAWAKSFNKLSSITTIVDSLQIGGIQMSEGIKAKTIIKGNRDVIETAISSLQGKKYEIEKLQLRIVSNVFLGKILLTNTGSMKIESNDDKELLSYFRQALAESQIN